MHRETMENKMLTPAGFENKATAAEPVRYRVPTGELDRAVYARLLTAGTHGAVDLLDLRTWRRSAAEVSEDAFVPTAAGITVQAQFAPSVIEAIAKACGLTVTIAPALAPTEEPAPQRSGLGVNLGRGFGPGYGRSYGKAWGNS